MGVLDELAEAGYYVTSVDDLRRSETSYRSAVPILLRELKREQDYGKKEWVVRALSVPWAKPHAIAPILEEFRSVPRSPSEKEKLSLWAMGNALYVLWEDSFFEDYMQLAREKRYGRGRQMIVLGFGKSKLQERATDFLLSLEDDPEVIGHAISALASLLGPPRMKHWRRPRCTILHGFEMRQRRVLRVLTTINE